MAEAEKSDPQAAHFRAFVSYSHADAAIAQKLHRKIEAYRLPKHLRDRETAGPDNGRLGRVFRDREDLPAAEDLSESVKRALAGSQVLVVICSPDARASIWVAREIELFRALHPGRPVLAALVRGEPEDSFPAPLMAGAEPLAADLRKEGDGWRLGFLKIIAGIAGVPLDALVQRDATRRLRRVMAVTGGALVALLATIGMTIYAIQSRNEAQRQQAEAEGLVEYMLTDLRTELKGVGRLDVMTKVNERAMDYYEGQGDLSGMPAESLERRARILHAMGEDDEKRKYFQRASAKFNEAHRVTEALLAREPNNVDRIFAHAQSENWLGLIAYWKKDYTESKYRYDRNKNLVDRLIARNKVKPEWWRHAGYSYGNLCASNLASGSDAKLSLEYCAAAFRHIAKLVEMDPQDKQAWSDLANRHAWLSDAYFANDMDEQGRLHREMQVRMVEKAYREDPENTELRDQWVRTQMVYAEFLIAHSRFEEAGKFAHSAATMIEQLIGHDPENTRWKLWRDRIQKLIEN